MRTPIPPEQAASDEAAQEAALRILARGPRTEREVRDRLAERGYLPDAVERAVERLRRVSLLDDRAYLVSFVRSELFRKPQALRLLQAKLERHGVPGALVASAEESIRADPDIAERSLDSEAGRAEAAAREVERKLARRNPDERKRRLQSALLRRGFSWDTIRDLVPQESARQSPPES